MAFRVPATFVRGFSVVSSFLIFIAGLCLIVIIVQ